MTPATKAPIAIDSPASCISVADPITTSSAAAIIASLAPVLAMMRNSGLMR